MLNALAELAEVAGEAAELAALVVRDALVGLDERDIARRDALIGERRRLELAVPFESTSAQIDEITRARAYADELGIEMEVTFVR
ncbi:hypothetical protein [Amorphus coralli]|uniref:hypothetical protein n=1 Tax=Amorphus coralli TaxID=340680 RepID=UPI000381A432|nr:hypothetical protein [Amorphus coralli]